VALAALPIVHWGCTSPSAPPSPPAGGRQAALSFTQFEQVIEPILVRHGCDAGGDCHGGGIRGTLELSPQSDKDPAFDFTQVSLQVNGYDPAASPVLTKPLAEDAGGAPHGFEPFADTQDADYQTILAWIESGSFQ
jgi:hypothetical protein